MAWNEPGDGDKNKDPWGNRGDQGPPDLDEAIRKLQSQLSGIFGGKRGGGGGAKGGASLSGGLLGLIGFALLAIYAFAGVYQVDQQERGLVFRFGAAQDVLKDPGLHWNPPLIDVVELVNVTQVRSHNAQSMMLTKDENIVDVNLTVQWVVDDAKAYRVNVKNPEVSLDHATESALRHVVGSSTMNQVITDGREAIAAEVQSRLQDYLNTYGTGIFVRKVNIDRSAPPSQVQDAFNDVQKAKEDQQRFVNQATAYQEQVIPEARGRAQRQIEEASAYRDQVIARSTGEANRFESLLNEYMLAKEVTRDRLYITALESVMSNASKVMIDVDGGNNMMYLPLDQLTRKSAAGAGEIDQTMMDKAVERILREVNAARANSSRTRSN
ncbi:MAG: FtsH protease activity modulator HflK [Gammaproteobacteria bacterium]|jgi:modulator of FtsH protease HflK|nr:FtsH protease activity modulator HflK [Gammaproteobacteria bacterium]